MFNAKQWETWVAKESMRRQEAAGLRQRQRTEADVRYDAAFNHSQNRVILRNADEHLAAALRLPPITHGCNRLSAMQISETEQALKVRVRVSSNKLAQTCAGAEVLVPAGAHCAAGARAGFRARWSSAGRGSVLQVQVTRRVSAAALTS